LIENSGTGKILNHWVLPKTEQKQLIAIDWSDTSGIHNCGISAWVDNDVVTWVKEAPNSDAEIIANAMYKTEKLLLLNKPSLYDFSFQCYGENRFGFHVPGDACDLSVNTYGTGLLPTSCGVNLSDHNVDHRFQQIEFIVGLSVMNDLVEKWLQKSL